MSSPASSIKVAVIGAGSTYTPELIEGLARRSERLPIDELCLMDIADERLEIVGGLARRMLDRLGWPGRLSATTSREEAIDGASFVLVQLRVGGQAMRLTDETVPPRFGTIGQETTGAGGFAKALRTVPIVLELAELTAQRAAQDAWLIDFTNPVGIVTQALLDAGHRAIGLCNVAIGVQRRMAAHFAVAPDAVQLGHVGLNHLSWVRNVWIDGSDRLPELLARDPERLADEAGGIPVELINGLASIPSSYLRYYYCFGDVLREQLDGAHFRAQEVMDIENQLLEMYRDPALDTKPQLLENRGGAFYSEAALGLVASLVSGDGAVHEVDVRNDGTLAGFADDDVVEVPARVEQGRIVPLPQEPLAPELQGLAQHMAAYERVAARAAVTGDPALARKALLAHPLVGQHPLNEELAQRMLDAELSRRPQEALA